MTSYIVSCPILVQAESEDEAAYKAFMAWRDGTGITLTIKEQFGSAAETRKMFGTAYEKARRDWLAKNEK